MSAAPGQVVVGYDGSDRARKALDAARRVAAPGARVRVVYAHRVPPGAPPRCSPTLRGSTTPI